MPDASTPIHSTGSGPSAPAPGNQLSASGKQVNLAPIIAEGEALLSSASGLKPGIQTSEFYLLAALNAIALLLIYLGKADSMSTLGILGTVDGYYIRSRTNAKLAASTNAVGTPHATTPVQS